MTLTQELDRAIRNVPDFPEPGIQFKDITPLLADPRLLLKAVEALVGPYAEAGVTKVLGIEARGFILGSMIAHALDAGFVPVRKKGKLPYRTLEAAYSLEYGKDVVEMHVDAVTSDDVVLIHDDVIATGGTAAAASKLVQLAGGTVVGYSFLIELGFLDGRARLDGGRPVHAVLSY